MLVQTAPGLNTVSEDEVLLQIPEDQGAFLKRDHQCERLLFRGRVQTEQRSEYSYLRSS